MLNGINDRLEAMLNTRVSFETLEGHYRNGELTAINWATLEIEGKTYRYPESLVLDGDGIYPTPVMRIIHLGAGPKKYAAG
jgi:hypothetical protein